MDEERLALAVWLIIVTLAVAGFLFWWPLILYSWRYWFGG